eukprot:gb/GFBE01049959.1/.p1 GENE.gb/GFBE01049959.1/~~gb/GFBE01049959.1/.p1  ORF type:complete len:194 (+),score=37.06 gb/GFBE01049959.1/:1-582(+)
MARGAGLRLLPLLALLAAGLAWRSLAPSFAASSVMPARQQTSKLDQESAFTAQQGLAAVASALQLETGWPTEPAFLTAQNPPWAKCIVESSTASKSVLEEWVMRGERETVGTFVSWRKGGAEPATVRCVETAAKEAMEAVCLDCVSVSEIGFLSPSSQSLAGAVALRMFGVSECLASAASSAGFCKSGVVSMV